MVKSAVQVCVRTRPTDRFAHDVLNIDTTANTIGVFIPKDLASGYVNNQQERWNFKFDSILHNSPQENVYDHCARPVVHSLLEGFNGTVLVYGQTGAGKTFTMTGGTDNYKFRGIIPRTIGHVFREVADRADHAITVRCSYLEIYNEMMFDLLATDATAAVEDSLQIEQDASGRVNVRGLAQRIANSEEEALNLLFEGETNRAIAEHQLNSASSRSHCIFTIHLESRSRVESAERVVRAKLNLVDLAGSERVKKTQSEGLILKEATYINRSLSFLEQVVIALSDKRRDHVPYRQSKLTNVLKDSLGGNCKTYMIANIWPELEHVDETISTLRFATRMMRVSNEAVANVDYDPVLLCKKYEREIADLKKELAMRDSLTGRAAIAYDAYSEEQRFELRGQLKKYLANEIEVDHLEINSLRHMREILAQFKELWKGLNADVSAARSQAAPAVTAAAPVATTAAADVRPGVGDVTGGKGFAAGGVAPRDAKPATKVTVTEPRLDGTSPTLPKSSGTTAAAATPAELVPPSRPEAFELYKQGPGAESNKSLVDLKASVREKKRVLKDQGQRVNQIKRAIDMLRVKVEQKKSERDGRQGAEDAEIIDEEEFGFLRDLKESKKQYRELFDKVHALKSEADYEDRLVEQARTKLISDFETWYAATYSSGDAPEPSATPTADDDVRYMDDQERFDRMEAQRITQDDPDSLAFYNARKAAREKLKLTQKTQAAGAKAKRR
eukprot:TRINITY_DN14039_c0_g1_i1.p1 TRINITY_DN14039_c0_g1~~TRINITY_DN14039_c0_g1_i1.p1  ORF type:complete len:730 (-),score=199.31 TRINITY_DN14039_c0_g1_i1:78-2267(-)